MGFNLTLTDIIVILMSIGCVFGFGIWVLRRKMASWTLRIIANLANPNLGPRTFYLLPDKRTGHYIVYRTIMSFIPYKRIPQFVCADYVYEVGGLMNKGKIDAYECPLGEMDDITIVPVRHTTASPVQVKNQVEYVQKQIASKLHEVAKADGKLDTEKIEKVFTPSFWGSVIGFIPMEDVKPFYDRHRQAVKFFYQRSYEKEAHGDSLLVKYFAYIILAILIIASGIWMAVVFNAGSTANSALVSTADAVISHNQAAGIGTALPVPTTTISQGPLSTITHALTPGTSGG